MITDEFRIIMAISNDVNMRYIVKLPMLTKIELRGLHIVGSNDFNYLMDMVGCKRIENNS